uniref:Uncharacterized protein n=1 Tax=viral metagenome TaxID=1070528 RepID=A0A2V0RH31_9ZZZZ
MNSTRGRNLVRHRISDGRRRAPRARTSFLKPPPSVKPPSAGVKPEPEPEAEESKPPMEEEIEEEVELVDPHPTVEEAAELTIVSQPVEPTRIIDIRKPRELLDLPLLISKEDLADITSRDSISMDDGYEVLLIESQPMQPEPAPIPPENAGGEEEKTLLPKEWDEAVATTLLPGAGVGSTNEIGDVLISAGGLVAAPGVPKPNAVVGIGMAKTGDIIKSLNKGDYTGAIYDASPIAALQMDEQSGAIDRMVKTFGLVGSLVSGDLGGAKDSLLTPAPEAEERKPSEHIAVIGKEVADYGEALGSGLTTGLSNLDKVGEGFKVLGGIFNAASKFDDMTEYVTSLPGIRKVEEDRYYTVYFYPRKGITYIEWKPTEDVRNILSRSKFKNVLREWTEDFVAAAGAKVPAWSRRVKYINAKYGPESDTVKHYGYSRGGGIATHLGGTGYGTGYFSSYAPSATSKSKLSGDVMHDLIINPLSYMLLLRKRMQLT